MRWFRRTLNEAGFFHLTSTSSLFALGLVGVLVGTFTLESTSILGLAISAAVGAIGLLLEALIARARSRRETISALFPEVLDFLISAISSGCSISESILELAEEGPPSLRPHFQGFKEDIDRGKSLVSSLEFLKVRLGDIHSDRLIELLVLVSEAGGSGVLDSLRNQVQLVRQDLAFSGEMSSRLGWITGTAKIAVGAPWLVVAMLSTRPENASAYGSAEGTMILILGLAVSVFAFRLVKVFGLLPVTPRVFA